MREPAVALDPRPVLRALLGATEANPLQKVRFMLTTIFDLDGTLANHDHRLHLAPQFPDGDWAPFTHAAVNDTPNRGVIALLDALFDHGGDAQIWTSRPEYARGMTVDWLSEHVRHVPVLRMRPNDDYRPPACNEGGLGSRIWPQPHRGSL